MICRQERDTLALALRRLAAGVITNDEFDDGVFEQFYGRTDDPALSELSIFGWLHYSDFSRYRLRGRKALTREERSDVASAVLFLKTDQEYVHGDYIKKSTCLGTNGDKRLIGVLAFACAAGGITYFALKTFVLGFASVVLLACLIHWVVTFVRANMRRRERGDALADDCSSFMIQQVSNELSRFWPFMNHQSYWDALAHPPFLCGKPRP